MNIFRKVLLVAFAVLLVNCQQDNKLSTEELDYWLFDRAGNVTVGIVSSDQLKGLTISMFHAPEGCWSIVCGDTAIIDDYFLCPLITGPKFIAKKAVFKISDMVNDAHLYVVVDPYFEDRPQSFYVTQVSLEPQRKLFDPDKKR